MISLTDLLQKKYQDTIQAAYEELLETYLNGQELDLVVTAINDRHQSSWNRHQITEFLVHCFDKEGSLINSNFSNPVYQKLHFEFARFKEFFSNQKDDSLNLRDKFLLDAIHQHIVGKLQYANEEDNEEDEVNGEINPAGSQVIIGLRALVKSDLPANEDFGGVENVLTANLVTSWCLETAEKIITTEGLEPDAAENAIISPTSKLVESFVTDYEQNLPKAGHVPKAQLNSETLSPELLKGSEKAEPDPEITVTISPAPIFSVLGRLGWEVSGTALLGGIGAGVGALLGTFVFPGVGTLIGASLGAAMGLGAGLIAVGIERGYSNGWGNKFFGPVITTVGAAGLGGVVGGLVGTFLFPGLGTAIGAAIGAGFTTACTVLPMLVVNILDSIWSSSTPKKQSKESEPLVQSYNKMNEVGLLTPAPSESTVLSNSLTNSSEAAIEAASPETVAPSLEAADDEKSQGYTPWRVKL